MASGLQELQKLILKKYKEEVGNLHNINLPPQSLY